MFDSEEDSPKKLQQDKIFQRREKPYFEVYPKISDFKLIKQIAKGNFGEVGQYFSPSKNENFAIKRMKCPAPNDDQSILEIKRQLDMLYKIDCDYVIHLYDHFEDQQNVYLIMELVNGKNLYEAIMKPRKDLPLPIICAMIEEICLGLEHLHQAKVIHRDLKLQNVMLFDGKIKIVDLGQSNHFGEGIVRKTRRGTRTYFAPEILNHEEQDDRVDTWCLGVIIYEIICLRSPFSANIKTESDLDENIRRLRYPIPDKIKNEKELLNLFSKIFTYKNQRYRVEQIRSHPFMKKNLKPRNLTITFENVFDEKKTNQYRSFLELQIGKYRGLIQQIADSSKEIEMQIEETEKELFALRQMG